MPPAAAPPVPLSFDGLGENLPKTAQLLPDAQFHAQTSLDLSRAGSGMLRGNIDEAVR
jgi:hypothetical protein